MVRVMGTPSRNIFCCKTEEQKLDTVLFKTLSDAKATSLSRHEFNISCRDNVVKSLNVLYTNADSLCNKLSELKMKILNDQVSRPE